MSWKKLRDIEEAIKTASFKLLCLLFLLLIGLSPAMANEIKVENGQVVQVGDDRFIEFDLSWENSWRTDDLNGDGVTNWDAAWVFVKYRVGEGEWQHAKLHSSGHSTGSGTPATLEIGVPNEREAFHSSDNPGVGAFIYRSENGTGTFSTTGNQLRWNYGVDDIADDAELDLKVFAIEMVYVAPGAFWLGSGGDENGRFHAGGSSNTTPFQATESWDGCIENTNGCLWGIGTASNNDIGGTGNLHVHYPTGVEGFYSMKYSISQQQYVDFLNTLTPSQASNRAYTDGGNRNGISVSDGLYSTDNPFVANNFMSWMDGAAYMDWAGLRPMTELEYEKAARGPANPVANEFAWGTAQIASQAYSLSNADAANESINANYSTSGTAGNALYFSTRGSINGPVRVGIFATSGSNRVEAGAGYWGIMELSGNLSERAVTVGNGTGRGFTGLHGNGQLTIEGYSAVTAWPGGGESGVTEAAGSGFRGGNFAGSAPAIRVSHRSSAATNSAARFQFNGFRGVRSLPAGVEYSLELDSSPADGGTVSGAGDYEAGTNVTISAVPNEGYTFANWTGDVEHLSDVNDANTTLSMPAANITLVANFEQEPVAFTCGDDITFTYRENVLTYGTVLIDYGGTIGERCWMDRNLGADPMPFEPAEPGVTNDDTRLYGDLFQWGRGDDGHQDRDSEIYEDGLASTFEPNTGENWDGKFITVSDSPFDWLETPNNNLWQPVEGIVDATNNPCPSGWRIPNMFELNADREGWGEENQDAAGAFASALKWPVGGIRYDDGTLDFVGVAGSVWSSSISDTDVSRLDYTPSLSSVNSSSRAWGINVRCIRD